MSDNGNILCDADFGQIPDPVKLSKDLDSITGLVEHGLFVNIVTEIYIK